ncbi:MAG: PAS domain S-box protein [Chthoniobacterales bacterium]
MPADIEVTLKRQADFFDISHDAIFSWRHPGRIETWNEGAVELYGYRREEAIGQEAHKLLGTRFPKPWEKIQKELRRNGRWRGQLVHRTRAGHEIDVSAHLQLLAQDAASMLILESTVDLSEISHYLEQLNRRARDQAISARFSLDALQARDIQAVFNDATHILRENMKGDLSAIFERSADGKSLRLRAGAGWKRSEVGSLEIEVNEKMPTGRALQLNQPIIIQNQLRDPRFSLPKFMRDRSVVSSMAVVIPGSASAYGVLGVGTRSARVFDSDDIHFLESIGNILATAISRLQFESELRDIAARLRGIVETAVDGIITIDHRGIVETINPAAERIFGYAANEVIGRNVSMLMPEPYRSEHDGYIEHYHKTGERRIIGIGREVRGRRKDGTEFPMDLAVSATDLGQRGIFTGLVRDIAERKRLEQEILDISDHEQRRIGSDLHDDLCQRLAGVRFSCDALRNSLGKIPLARVAERVEKIGASVSEAIDRTRTLARGLSPVVLEANGLASALHELTEGVRQLFAIDCRFENKGEVAVRNAIVATHLYRIAQEAINNALKHGQPSILLVALERRGEKAILTVHDDGAGFSIDQERSHGMGLRTIAYRAGMIGADVVMQSAPGKGATLACTFSLDG